METYKLKDKVFLETLIGLYRGIVEEVREKEIVIRSFSPTGRGQMLDSYDKEDIEWKKFK